MKQLRLRRDRRRLRVRRQRDRAAADREGLPSRRARGGPPVGRRGPAEDQLERPQVDLGATARAHRPAADQRARQVPGVQRRRRRRRVADLRQHALRAAARVLPATGPGPTSPTGSDELAPYYDQAKRMLGVVENPRIGPEGRSCCFRSRATAGSPTRSTRPRSACSSTRAARAWRSTTPTSAAPGRAGQAASTARSASPAASTTPRTPPRPTTSTWRSRTAPRCTR